MKICPYQRQKSNRRSRIVISLILDGGDGLAARLDLSPLHRNAVVYLTGSCFGHRGGLGVFEGEIIYRSYRYLRLGGPASCLVTIPNMLFPFLVVVMRILEIEKSDYQLLHISLSAHLSA